MFAKKDREKEPLVLDDNHETCLVLRYFYNDNIKARPVNRYGDSHTVNSQLPIEELQLCTKNLQIRDNTFGCATYNHL